MKNNILKFIFWLIDNILSFSITLKYNMSLYNINLTSVTFQILLRKMSQVKSYPFSYNNAKEVFLI